MVLAGCWFSVYLLRKEAEVAACYIKICRIWQLLSIEKKDESWSRIGEPRNESKLVVRGRILSRGNLICLTTDQIPFFVLVFPTGGVCLFETSHITVQTLKLEKRDREVSNDMSSKLFYSLVTQLGVGTLEHLAGSQ